MHRMSFAVINPATEEPIAELEEAGVEQTDEAVARANAAFKEWRAVAPTDRARLLRRVATLVEEHTEELARIESQNVGKPIGGARAEVGMVAQVFHFYAGAVDKHHGETIPVAGGIDMTFREPLGVVDDVAAVESLVSSDMFSSLPLEGDRIAEDGDNRRVVPVDEAQRQLAARIGQFDLFAVGDVKSKRDQFSTLAHVSSMKPGPAPRLLNGRQASCAGSIPLRATIARQLIPPSGGLERT